MEGKTPLHYLKGDFIMMNFIKLTLTEGRGDIWVNKNRITAICETESGTAVFCFNTDDPYLTVKESAEEIIKMINFNPDNRI